MSRNNIISIKMLSIKIYHVKNPFNRRIIILKLKISSIILRVIRNLIKAHFFIKLV